jgi:hypothetical protein
MSEKPPAKDTGNLSPRGLVAQIVQQRQRLFAAVYAETPFLLVRLDDPSGELQAGLSMTSAATGSAGRAAKGDGLGFYTVQQGQSDRPGSGQTPSLRPKLNIQLLQRRILNSPHYIVELRKRDKESTFANRISVGRARNQDVVLRQGSVSKSHAWFETDENGALMVADAGSKNGTRVRGQLLDVRVPSRIQEGDVVEFGTVEATFLGADTLWRLLHE